MPRKPFNLSDDESGYELGSGALGDPGSDPTELRNLRLALGSDPLTNDGSPTQGDRFKREAANTMASLRNVQVDGSGSPSGKRRKKALRVGAASGATRSGLEGNSAQPGDMGPNWALPEIGSQISALDPAKGAADREYTQDYIEASAPAQYEAHLNQKVGMGKGEQQRYALSGMGQAFLNALPLLGHIAGLGDASATSNVENFGQGMGSQRTADTWKPQELPQLEATPASQSYGDALENQLQRGVGAPRKGLGMGQISEQQASRVTPRVGRALEPRSQFPEPQGPGRQGNFRSFGDNMSEQPLPEKLPDAPFGGRDMVMRSENLRGLGKMRRKMNDPGIDPLEEPQLQSFEPEPYDAEARTSVFSDLPGGRPKWSGGMNLQNEQYPGQRWDAPVGENGPMRDGSVFGDHETPRQFMEQPIVKAGPLKPTFAIGPGGDQNALVKSTNAARIRSGDRSMFPAQGATTPAETSLSPTKMTPASQLSSVPEELPPVEPQEWTPRDMLPDDLSMKPPSLGGFEGTMGAKPSNVGTQGINSLEGFDAQMAPMQQQLRSRGMGPIPQSPMDLENTTTVMSPEEVLSAVRAAPDEQAALEVLKKADPSVLSRIMNRLPDDLRLALLIWGVAGAEAGYLGAQGAQPSTGPGSK